MLLPYDIILKEKVHEKKTFMHQHAPPPSLFNCRGGLLFHSFVSAEVVSVAPQPWMADTDLDCNAVSWLPGSHTYI